MSSSTVIKWRSGRMEPSKENMRDLENMDREAKVLEEKGKAKGLANAEGMPRIRESASQRQGSGKEAPGESRIETADSPIQKGPYIGKEYKDAPVTPESPKASNSTSPKRRRREGEPSKVEGKPGS